MLSNCIKYSSSWVLIVLFAMSCQSDKAPISSKTIAEVPADTSKMMLLEGAKDTAVSVNKTDSVVLVVDTPQIKNIATAPPISKVTVVDYDLPALAILDKLPDTAWVDLEQLDSTLIMDIRYATTNNFMELQVYDCAKCYTRAKTAKAVLKIQAALSQQGLGLKMFDCYRPGPAQYKLWQKMPDKRYVAPPEKGSVHSRGGALDLTIVVLQTGQELEMGTPYDYFGREAYWSYTKHPENVNNNRKLLRSTMEAYGFKITTTEWWHYSYRRAWYKLSNMEWDCE